MDGQPYLQKIITSTKKLKKGQQELDKTCIEVKLLMKKLQMLMKTRFVRKLSFSMKLQGMLMQLNIYYYQQSLHMQARVFDELTQAIAWNGVHI